MDFVEGNQDTHSPTFADGAGDTKSWDRHAPARETSDKPQSSPLPDPDNGSSLRPMIGDESTNSFSEALLPFGDRMDSSAAIPLAAIAWLMPLLVTDQATRKNEKNGFHGMRSKNVCDSGLGWDQFADGFDPFALLADKFNLVRS